MSSWDSLRVSRVRKYYFLCSLLIYTVTMVGNLPLSWLWCSVQPWTPLCTSFLGYLSFMDTVYSTTVTPNMIMIYSMKRKNHFLPSLHDTTFYRTLIWWCWDFTPGGHGLWPLCAICKPSCIIWPSWVSECVMLLLLAWVGGFLHAVVQLLFVYSLPFCGPNVIDHFICDMYPLLKLACTDTYIIGLTVVGDGAICVVIFMLLLLSYGVILHSLKNLNQEGRHKALSTCGSYIIVVVLFLCPVFLCMWPPSTLPIDKSLTVFYTIITPMLNPSNLYSEKCWNEKCHEKLWTNKRKWGKRKVYHLFSMKNCSSMKALYNFLTVVNFS